MRSKRIQPVSNRLPAAAHSAGPQASCIYHEIKNAVSTGNRGSAIVLGEEFSGTLTAAIDTHPAAEHDPARLYRHHVTDRLQPATYPGAASDAPAVCRSSVLLP
jgi:hypothetical protein